jgi:transcriptional regulator with XRE-family HTH domain
MRYLMIKCEGNFSTLRHLTSERRMPKNSHFAAQLLEVYSLGRKLRTLRTQKHLTLSRLAADTGLSTALLSKLETNSMIPTLSTLATISRAFGVDLSFFFAAATKHNLSITRRASEIGDGRLHVALKMTSLNMSADARLCARVVEFPPGVTETLTKIGLSLSSVVYVLEGVLCLNAGGVQELLEAGDCVCLDSEMYIAWRANGKSRCRALVVTPGQAA